MRMGLKMWRIAAVLLTAALLGGCVSLKAVQDYSAASRKTLENVRTVADDYLGACVRMERFGGKGPFDANRCDEVEKGASDGIKAAVKIVDAYLAALNSLAEKGVPSTNKNVEKLTDAVKSTKRFKDDEVKAFGSIAQLVSKITTELYVERQVIRSMTNADAAMGNATEALERIVAVDYLEALDAEKKAWKSQYVKLSASATGAARLDWTEYVSKSWDVKVELEAKGAAAKSLAESLKAMRMKHAELVRDARQLDANEVRAAVSEYAEAVWDAAKDFNAAFGKQ